MRDPAKRGREYGFTSDPLTDPKEVFRLSDREILMKLVDSKFRDVKIVREKLTEIDEPFENHPEYGTAIKTRSQYKATIHYQFIEGDTATPRVDVVHFEQITFREMPKPTVAQPQPTANPIGRKPRLEPTDVKDTESRLDEVERKLDRILRALERGKSDVRPAGDAPPSDDVDDAPRQKPLKP